MILVCGMPAANTGLTDPETGERMQVATVAGAVTDWTAVRGVAKLWGTI